MAAIESQATSESKTIVARLPSTELPGDPEEHAPDETPAPKRRLGLRRRKPAETGAADP